MTRHFRDRKDKKQGVTDVVKKRDAGMRRLFSAARQTRPPSLPRQTRPSGVQTSLGLPRPSIPLRLRPHRGSVISAEHREHRAPRVSTEKKVLWGIFAAFLMGVVYTVWISMQMIRCCG